MYQVNTRCEFCGTQRELVEYDDNKASLKPCICQEGQKNKKPCKHEWRQYWKDESYVIPTDKFYCIHCLQIKEIE